ncbi:MAG TPA: TetR/AcrR family transcriptional regulator [Solirubrobacterales bacterium]|nr:TetR/AcrR family transcriptional regulator [Solirubrobacterales bacterium]
MKSLPRGRHGLSREFVAQNQLERLLTSIAESLHEHGYDNTTVSVITAHARVSKSDFYRHFQSKDECFLAAYDDSVERLRRRVLDACAAEGDWTTAVAVALRATLGFLAAEPARADLLFVEGLRAGPDVYGRFQKAVQSFVPYLRSGAPQPAGGEPPGDGVAEAVVGGIASLLSRWVLAGQIDELEERYPEIAEFALTPYLGGAEARRVGSRGA